MQDTKIVYSQIYNKRMDAVVSSLLSILVIYQEAELRDHMVTTFLTSKLFHGSYTILHPPATHKRASFSSFSPTFVIFYQVSQWYMKMQVSTGLSIFAILVCLPPPPSWQCFFFSENTDSGSRLLVNIKYKLL